jgi:Uma2 family endonuclease
MRPKRVAPAEPTYPESDGKPMAETDVHRNWMVWIIEMLQYFFRGMGVYVSGNLLIYYQRGDPKKRVAPDVFVARECEPRLRRVFKIWEEPNGPSFALEVTSKKTRRQDLGPKKDLYARLRIAEYLLYDPLGEWLDPALQGFRLVDGGYASWEPDENGGLVSQQLGITFRLEEGDLALFNTATGERLKRDTERAREAEARLNDVAWLEQQLSRLRTEQNH